MANNNQVAFYYDQSRCMGCNACTVGCKDWNQLNPGPVNWRTQETHEVNGGFFPLSMGCNHCEEPACVAACGFNAITKDDESGIVTIDRNKCQNLQACITACPFAKPQIASDRQETEIIVGWQIEHPAQKCTLCRDRLAADEKPTCVLSCVGRALDFGTVSEITSKYPDAVQLNPSEFPYAFVNNRTDTKPSYYVKKKTAQITIHKK